MCIYNKRIIDITKVFAVGKVNSQLQSPHIQQKQLLSLFHIPVPFFHQYNLRKVERRGYFKNIVNLVLMAWFCTWWDIKGCSFCPGYSYEFGFICLFDFPNKTHLLKGPKMLNYADNTLGVKICFNQPPVEFLAHML